MGASINCPLKPPVHYKTIVLIGLRGPIIVPIMPRDASLFDSYKSDPCCLSSLSRDSMFEDFLIGNNLYFGNDCWNMGSPLFRQWLLEYGFPPYFRNVYWNIGFPPISATIIGKWVSPYFGNDYWNMGFPLFRQRLLEYGFAPYFGYDYWNNDFPLWVGGSYIPPSGGSEYLASSWL